MNNLFQTSSGFIALEKDLENLKTKEQARLLCYSDSHGNYRILLKVLKQFGPSCDALIFCGDGICDLAEIFELCTEDTSLKKILPPVIAIVKGNGDPTTYPVSFDIGKYNPASRNDMKGTMFIPEKQILIANNTKFFITHGHHQNVYFGLEQMGMATTLNECQVGLYGHTHVSQEDSFKTCKIINPGSISRPRGGDVAGFAIITVEKNFTDTAFIKISNSQSDVPQFSIK